MYNVLCDMSKISSKRNGFDRRTPNYADNKPLFTAKAQRTQRRPFFSFDFESHAEAGCKQKQMKNTYTLRPLRLCGDSVCSKVCVRQCVSSEQSERVANKIRLSKEKRDCHKYSLFGHGLNLGHLISHRAHREKSKKLCELCGLCERKGKCV